MATVRIGADVSEFKTAALSFAQTLKGLKNSAIDFGDGLSKINEYGTETVRVLTGLNDAGQKVVVTFKNTGSQMETVAATIEDTSKKARGLSDSFNITASTITRLLEALAIKRVGYQLLNELQQSVTKAKDLSIRIAEIQTISQSANISTEEWAAGLTKLSNEFGNTRVDIAEAAYQSLSSQLVKNKDTFDLLNTTLQFSKATVSSAANSSLLLTSALNSFKLGADQATNVANSFSKAIEVGRLRAEQISNTFGRVGAVAHAVGVNLNETLAAMTTLTRQGITAQDAMTLLTNVFTQILQPGSKLNEFLREQIGVSGQAAIAQRGLVGVLRLLDAEAQKNSSSTAELTNNIRTIRGLIGLTGDAFKDYEKDLKEIGNANDDVAKKNEIVQDSLGQQFVKQLQRVKNEFENTFGTPLLRVIADFSKFVGGDEGLVGGFKRFIDVIKQVGTLVFQYTAYLAAFKAAMIALTAVTTASTFSFTGLIASMQGLAYSTATALTSIKAFLIANPFVIFATGITAATLAFTYFNEQAKKTSANINDLKDILNATKPGREENQKRINEAETRSLKEVTDSTKENINKRYEIVLEYIGNVIRLNDRVRQKAIDNNKDITEQLQLSSKTFIDRIQRGITELNNQATKAKHLVDESKKITEDIPKKTSDITFQERLKYAYGGDANATGYDTLFPNQKLQLIKDRIIEVTRLAKAEASKNNEEGIKEARRYYDEVEQLERQKFDLQTEQQKKQFEARVAAGEEQPIGYDASGQPRYLFLVQTTQLEQKIKQLTSERLALERQIQDVQSAKQKEAISNAEKEKAKAEELRELIKKAAEYQSQIYDKEGKVKPEFLKDPTKITEGFEKISRRITELAGPDAFRQDLRFFQDLYKQKISIAREAELAIKAEELKNLTEKTTKAKDAEISKATNAEKAVKDANEEIKTSSDQLNAYLKLQANQVINQRVSAQGETSFGEVVKQRKDVELQKSYADELRKTFESNKTLENAKAYAEAIDNLNQKIKIYIESSTGKKVSEVNLPQDTVSVATRISLAETNARQLVQAAKAREEQGLLLESLGKKSDGTTNKIKDMNAEVEKIGPSSKTAADTVRENFNNIGLSIDPILTKVARLKADLADIANNPIAIKKNEAPGLPIGEAPGQMFGGMPEQYYSAGGMIRRRHKKYYDDGGWIGMRPRGSDQYPVMAGKGEYIVNAEQSQKFAPLLEAINHKHYTEGIAKTSIANVGDIHVVVNGGQTDELTVRRIAQGLRRELRRGTVTLD